MDYWEKKNKKKIYKKIQLTDGKSKETTKQYQTILYHEIYTRCD